jgi:hypothetical protein
LVRPQLIVSRGDLEVIESGDWTMADYTSAGGFNMVVRSWESVYTIAGGPGELLGLVSASMTLRESGEYVVTLAIWRAVGGALRMTDHWTDVSDGDEAGIDMLASEMRRRAAPGESWRPKSQTGLRLAGIHSWGM